MDTPSHKDPNCTTTTDNNTNDLTKVVTDQGTMYNYCSSANTRYRFPNDGKLADEHFYCGEKGGNTYMWVEVKDAGGKLCTGTGAKDSVRWLCTHVGATADDTCSAPGVSKGYGVYLFADAGPDNVDTAMCPSDNWLNQPGNTFKAE